MDFMGFSGWLLVRDSFELCGFGILWDLLGSFGILWDFQWF